MNLKKKILVDLELEDLIDSNFEKLIKIKKLTVNDEILDIKYREQGALYLYSGVIATNIFTAEGREAYRYFEEGSFIGISESLSDIIEKQTYGIDFKVVKEATVAYLPLKNIFNEVLENKEKLYRRFFNLIAEEKLLDHNYIMGRIAYSDEEFFLKALESKHSFNIPTPELAKALNMGVRNLQRYIKIYSKLGIIEKTNGRITIKDMKKFNEYMESVLK